MSHIEDINVEERVANGQHKIPSTDIAYAVQLNQFCEFLRVDELYIPGGPMISPNILNDRNFAAFLIHLGDSNDHKPHFLKATRAAFAYALKRNGIPNITDFAHLYPQTHATIDVNYYYLKFNINNKSIIFLKN